VSLITAITIEASSAATRITIEICQLRGTPRSYAPARAGRSE
jgi:hypothetical protein